MARNKKSEPSSSQEVREKAVLHARRRRDSAARTAVLWTQLRLCAVLLGALLLCRSFCPDVFESVRQFYFAYFETVDESPQLVRFASAMLEKIPVLKAEAAGNTEIPAPAGCSAEAYIPTQPLIFPLGNVSWWLSSPYGWRVHPLTQQLCFHQGEDLACAEGEPVLAALDGVVMLAKYSASYGNYLRVHHADGVDTLYAHLQYLFVRTGEIVTAGQVLGTAGQTGETTGPHLHFELFYEDTRYNPAAALGIQEEIA